MSKQILAKIGVFALIVVNLGAYYVFWPDNAPRGPAAPSADLERGENPGKPLQFASIASAAQPGDSGKSPLFPGNVPPPSVPAEGVQKANILTPPPVSPLSIGGKDDLPSIPDPNAGPKPLSPSVAGPDLPPINSGPILEQLRRAKEGKAATGSAPAAPITLTGGFPTKKFDNAPLEPPSAGPASPIQLENSPWSLQMEIAAGHTTLTARLHKRTEFRILCDRVEMKTPGGSVVAVGKVSFTGPGIKGTCNQLTIGLSGESLLLDGRAELYVQQGSPVDLVSPTAELKGEHLTLRLQQPATTTAPSPFSSPRPLPLVK